jgi:hypothetical protein
MKQEPPKGVSSAGALRFLHLLINAHTTSITVFTRHSFGTEALGFSGLCALGLLILVGGFSRSPDMLNYLVIWLVVLVAQRITTFRRVNQGWIEHSRYTGVPWLGFKFTRSELCAKGLVEPIICLIVGTLLMPVSETVGTFVMLGFFSLMIETAMQRQRSRVRLMAMRDAHIEQKALAEAFRGQREEF